MVEALVVTLGAIVALAVLARRLGLPEPLVFVLGGAGLGLVPGLPLVSYDSNAVFLVFFPLLLFSAAWTTSWNDFRPNAPTIVSLGLGAVVATTLVVGVVAKALIPGLSWPLCFLLGVILADPDFRTFFAVAARVGMPRRVTTVLGGEGLVEGTAQLTLYLAFSAAITAGAFSFFDVARALVVGPIIGAAVGLAMAWLVYQVDLRMPDPSLSITLSLLAPFAAYLPALAVGGNRLAAVAVAGLYLGWRADVTESPAVRLNADAAWLVLAFLLNGFVYVPAGMALPGVLRDLGGVSYAALLGWVLALTLAVLATRFLWVLGVHTLVRAVRGLLGRRTDVAWSERILFAYAPTRGAFAVASALALPLSAGAGEPFPARDLLIALSVGVMLVSVAAQGLTLPGLIRAIDLPEDLGSEREENLAWRKGAEAALERIDELADGRRVPEELAKGLRLQYRDRLRRYGSVPDGRLPGTAPDIGVRKDLIGVERAALLRLREEDAISDTVFRRVERELDIMELYLDY